MRGRGERVVSGPGLWGIAQTDAGPLCPAAAAQSTGVGGTKGLVGGAKSGGGRRAEEEAMETLTQVPAVLGRVSAQAGVLVVLVLLAQWLFRRHLTPRWRCALWGLVMLRLLLPVSLSSSAS